ncbi:MAG: PAS domain-containing sensor histidine kinase [Euryarchaeota archaeon]|nr:PAS domain-containing sensor histidine kinase [Euryarchaeota archaeon]
MGETTGMSNALAVQVLESVDAAVFVEDFNGKILYVNDRACEIFGYAKEDFYREGVYLILPEFEMKRLNELRELLYEKGRLEFEAINVGIGGRMIPVKIYAKIAELDDKKVAILTMYDLRPKRAYENVLHVLGEHALESIIMTDGEGTIIFWNHQAEKLFGYLKGEILGKKIYKILSDEAAEQFSRVFNTERRNYHTVPHFLRTKLKKFDGSEFYGEISCTVVKDRGAVYGIVLVRDISREMENEKKMEYELSQYRTILDKMLGGVMIIRDEKIVYVNKGFNIMTGYDIDSILNTYFIQIIYPDDRPIVLSYYRRRMADKSAPEEYVLRMIRNDGSVLWALVKPVKIILDGKPADLVSMVDVTRIKGMERLLFKVDEVVRTLNTVKSEKEVRRIVWNELHKDLQMDSLYFLKLDGRLGKLKIIEHFGKKILFSEPMCVRTLKSGVSYLPDGADFGLQGVSVYVVYLKDNGDDFGAMVVMRRGEDTIRSDERNIIDLLGAHVFLSLRNIEAMNQTRQSRNLQELLVHILTHDLKTHLAVINGYADLLLEEYSKEYVTAIKDAVGGAVEIIDKTNMFSKLDTGHMKEARKNVRLMALLEGVISTVMQKYSGIHIMIDGGEEEIMCYPLLMKEVLYNLINNAFAHGSRNVIVKTESEKDFVRVKVMDDGPGIPADILDKIFDPFFKYRSSGSGLGLAIVKRIIELHGGRIKVEPNEPKGSVFVIEIPKGV